MIERVQPTRRTERVKPIKRIKPPPQPAKEVKLVKPKREYVDPFAPKKSEPITKEDEVVLDYYHGKSMLRSFGRTHYLISLIKAEPLANYNLAWVEDKDGRNFIRNMDHLNTGDRILTDREVDEMYGFTIHQDDSFAKLKRRHDNGTETEQEGDE